MLIEIHMLQNHAPSNLNRDDTGSPKDCIFGGIRRSRISSQCIKKSIRKSDIFTEGLQGIELGVRTRRLPQQVKEILLAEGVAEELAEIAALKVTGFGTNEGKEQAKGITAQIMFLSQADIRKVAEVMLEAVRAVPTAENFKNIPAKDLQAKAELRGWRPITPDIALFGRMITSEAFRDVEAAMQVAHAISTHKMDHEFDYFTAVDDLQGAKAGDDELGAGMIGDVEFNSACYYKYFSLDFEGLVTNLAGPQPSEKASKIEKEEFVKSLAEARRVAGLSVSAFLKAAVFTTPSGKQNTFAAHQLPDAVLVEVRPKNTPVSYANAFVKAARARGEVDLVDDSLQKFADHVSMLTEKFSLAASKRLWFSTREVKIPDTQECRKLDDLLAELQKSVEMGEVSHG
jgi:CRISPR system Cascade subunit CasC